MQLKILMETNEELRRTARDGIQKQIACVAGGTAVAGYACGPLGAFVGFMFGIRKQIAWAAGGAAVGGLLSGLLCAFVGFIFGAVVGCYMSDDYQALVAALKNLSDENKKILVQKVQQLVKSNTIDALNTFINSNEHRESLLKEISKFVHEV